MTTDNAPRTYLTIQEAADEIQVSNRTIRRWIMAAKLPAVKMTEGGSGQWRIASADLHKFMGLD